MHESATIVAPTIERLAVRTPTLPPATHTNMYALGTRDVVLVEPATPFADELERTVAWAEALRSRGRVVRAILATHHHHDHIGGAAELRHRLGVPLWAHGRTAERAPHVTVDRYLEDGESFTLDGPIPTEIQSVLTPGHAPGHLCFSDSHSGMLIAGDMVASVGTIIVEPRDGDMILYLRSLAMLRGLNATALLPAHGDVITDATGKLDQYTAHRLAREGKVLAALRDQSQVASAVDLVPIAYADTDSRAWPLAAQSTEAHLIKLETDGLAERTDRGWRAVV